MVPPNKLSLDWDQTISRNKKVTSKRNKTKKKSANKKVENIQTDSTVLGLYLSDEMSIKDGEETIGMETISNIMPSGKRKKGIYCGSKLFYSLLSIDNYITLSRPKLGFGGYMNFIF